MNKEEKLEEVDESEWETTTGLLDDVDAYIINPRFEIKEDYTRVAGIESIMLTFDLVDAEGTNLTEEFPIGYSIGTGWKILNNGKEVENAARKTFIKNSSYGQFLDRVRKDLNVVMNKRGSPRQADVWNGLGFHWKRESVEIVGGDKRDRLLPTEYLGELNVAGKKEFDISDKLETKLIGLAKENDDIRDFQTEVIDIKEVAGNKDLMASILDISKNGFYGKARIE